MLNDLPYELMADSIIEEIYSCSSVAEASALLADQLQDVFERGSATGKFECIEIIQKHLKGNNSK